MSEMRIRTARPDDAGAIAQVYVETWRNAYAGLVPNEVLVGMAEPRQRRQWKTQISSGDMVLVADHPDYGIVGMGSCGPCREKRFVGSGEIYTLYVLPEWQEEGHGKDLLTAMLRVLCSSGFDGAVLWVLSSNPSRFFYEAMGGQQVAQREEYLWQTVLHELAYEWRPLPQPLLLGRSISDEDSFHDGGGS